MSKHDTWQGGAGTGDEIEIIGPSLGMSPRKAPKQMPAPEILEDDPNRLSGRIAKYISDRLFGFIARDDGEDDVFFHADAFPTGSSIRRGLNVTFEITQDIRSGRTHAVNARVIR